MAELYMKLYTFLFTPLASALSNIQHGFANADLYDSILYSSSLSTLPIDRTPQHPVAQSHQQKYNECLAGYTWIYKYTHQ